MLRAIANALMAALKLLTRAPRLTRTTATAPRLAELELQRFRMLPIALQCVVDFHSSSCYVTAFNHKFAGE